MSGGRGTFPRVISSVPSSNPQVSSVVAGDQLSAQKLVGQAMVRTGAAILIVPDPLPLVDELVGGALVVGGAVLNITA